MTKKLLSIIVAALMVLAIVPMAAFARGEVGKKIDLPAAKSAHGYTVRDTHDTVYAADFETEPTDWDFIDDDGDGFNWDWQGDYSETPHMTAYEGEGLIFSASYDSTNQLPLIPDNYAWTPAFTVPSTNLTYVSFWYRGQDSTTTYSAEVFKVYLKVNGNDVAISDDLTSTNAYQQFAVDISAYAGQSVQVGIRHYNVTDMFYLNIDSFEVFNTDEGYTPPATTPEPVIPPENIVAVYTNSYESQDDLANLAIYDMDQDGHYWGWYPVSSYAYDGTYFLGSESYYYEEDDDGNVVANEALTPDNWFVEEGYAFTVPETGGWVSVPARGVGSGYAAEHFGLVVGTVDAWTNEESEDDVYAVNSANGIEYETTAEWATYWFDLSDFAGETVYVGIRHFNCTDQYILMIDYVQYWVLEGEEPATTHTVTFQDWDGTVIDTQEVVDGEAAVAPADPTREGYTFTGWDVDFSNVTEDLVVTATYSVNQYSLTINYVYEDGTTAAASVRLRYDYGASYSIASPEIEGYTPDIAVVEGVMGAAAVTVTVTYFADEPAGLLGDVNNDGEVTMADVSALVAYLMNSGSLTPEGLANADANRDGEINILDATAIYAIAFGA